MDNPPRDGDILSAGAMNSFVLGKHQGGIRYSGNFPDIKRIAVLLGGGADAIYDDEYREDVIRYMGEGQQGDQQLTYGNRALVWAFLTEMPVHVFLRRDKNRYRYCGSCGVQAAGCTVAPDRNARDRGAFVFELVRRGSSH